MSENSFSARHGVEKYRRVPTTGIRHRVLLPIEKTGSLGRAILFAISPG